MGRRRGVEVWVVEKERDDTPSVKTWTPEGSTGMYSYVLVTICPMNITMVKEQFQADANHLVYSTVPRYHCVSLIT